MSDTIQIALIIAVVIVIALIIFRRQLSSFLFRVNKEGFEAELKTHSSSSIGGTSDTPSNPSKPSGINIEGNRQFGMRNKIEIERDDVNVEDNIQLGAGQEIVARSDKSTEKKQ